MGEGEPKYLNSPETAIFEKRKTLFGLNTAKKHKGNELILCEGYMDVISLHQAGFTNAVASLGTALTPSHAAVLKRYTSGVVLSYDSDGAGRNAAVRAIPILKNAGHFFFRTSGNRCEWRKGLMILRIKNLLSSF